MNNFWDKYPIIRTELEDIQEIMKENVKSSEKYIEKPLLELIESGGKLLRPAFLLLGGRFGQYDKDRLYPLAAVIELLHMATLVHDDIVDDSPLRRGNETIQSKYGKDYAVFMGDFLFCRCFSMLSNEYTTENMKNISNAISRICVGELRQYYLRRSQSISLKRYLKVISGKTAALFALSLYVGASESKCPEKQAKTLGKIGYNVGMAFQIIDDILDYTGDEKLLGKSIKGDLKEGVYTLPLIYALQKDKSGELRNLIYKDNIEDNDILRILDLAKEHGGIEKSRNLANLYTKKAFDQLNKLPDCEAKEILLDIINTMLKRNY
jgi:heptaprenyl diphosphate synthase